MNRQEKWDRRFLDLATLVASWSKDPSTKTGAVIVDLDNRVVSVGYNGFPKEVDDSPEFYENRDLKLKIIVHCERNALIFAEKSVKNCTLYTIPFISCAPCASMMIQAGISRVVAPKPTKEQLERWGEDFLLAEQMFSQTFVRCDQIDYVIPGL